MIGFIVPKEIHTTTYLTDDEKMMTKYLTFGLIVTGLLLGLLLVSTEYYRSHRCKAE